MISGLTQRQGSRQRTLARLLGLLASRAGSWVVLVTVLGAAGGLAGCEPQHIVSSTEQALPGADETGGTGSTGASGGGSGGGTGGGTGGADTVAPGVDDLCPATRCDDGIACSVDECIAETGECSFDDSSCECASDDDCLGAGPACALATCNPVSRSCELGLGTCECLADGPALACEDDNACTEDRCSAGACQNLPLSGNACDDMLDCSTDDTCQDDGSCAGDMSACEPVAVPAAWSCAPGLFANGQCDCGCGVPDSDCVGLDVASCSSCACEACGDFPAVCSTSCPVAVDDLGQCVPLGPPATWSCAPELYADGNCDCGCGGPDADCASAELAACDACRCQVCDDAGSCPVEICPVDPVNNAVCTWICPTFFYNNGDCDCGCGAPEPDCDATDDVDACDFVWCNPFGDEDELTPTATFSCANAPPVTPDSWICTPYFYGDGFCDCGCGATDADCNNTNRNSCTLCACADSSVADCPLVTNNDNAQCAL